MRRKSFCPCCAAAGRLSRISAKTEYRNMPDNAEGSHLILATSSGDRSACRANEICAFPRAATSVDNEIA